MDDHLAAIRESAARRGIAETEQEYGDGADDHLSAIRGFTFKTVCR